MKCPHCKVEIHPAFLDDWLRQGNAVGIEDRLPTVWSVNSMECPACHKAIVNLVKHRRGHNNFLISAYPKSSSRPAAPADVPLELAEDFNEACKVLQDSPKASAALSRRCLQQLLRIQGFSQHDLAKAIDAALASKTIPGALARNLDAIRNIGNFAAHPTKDTNSGLIVEVEPEEADWNLDVLDGLFDFYYVQPAQDQAKIDALNAKLLAAGKNPMKQ